MGWTSLYVSMYHDCFDLKGKFDRKAYLDREFGHEENERYIWDILKSSMVGSTWYGAIQRIDKVENTRTVYGEVIITSLKDGEFYYKEMSEDVGPYQYDCPVGILKLLSATDNEHALEWRRKCMMKRDRKKLEKAFFERSKEFDVHHIEFTTDCKYTGYEVGDVMSLFWHTVIRPYKKDIMFLTDGHYRWSTKLIKIENCRLIDKMGKVIPYPLG